MGTDEDDRYNRTKISEVQRAASDVRAAAMIRR
jgi:hypothetical protein